MSFEEERGERTREGGKLGEGGRREREGGRGGGEREREREGGGGKECTYIPTHLATPLHSRPTGCVLVVFKLSKLKRRNRSRESNTKREVLEDATVLPAWLRGEEMTVCEREMGEGEGERWRERETDKQTDRGREEEGGRKREGGRERERERKKERKKERENDSS